VHFSAALALDRIRLLLVGDGEAESAHVLLGIQHRQRHKGLLPQQLLTWKPILRWKHRIGVDGGCNKTAGQTRGRKTRGTRTKLPAGKSTRAKTARPELPLVDKKASLGASAPCGISTTWIKGLADSTSASGDEASAISAGRRGSTN
jgi:hypothetical protein